ncbi:MAG: hypothetical protein M3P96_06780 [Actinomycetota bacterium]|nr:hypothetical protein [Actinomycetota bacterium]
MQQATLGTSARALLVAAATCTALVGALGVLAWAASAPLVAVRAPGPATLDDLLTVSAAAGAGLCLAWLALGMLLAVAAAIPALASDTVATLAVHLTPPLARRLVAGLLGATVVGTAPGAATAVAPLATAGITSAASITSAAISPTSDARPPAPPELDRPAAGREERVVVRRGDTLWDLAAASLPPPRSEARTARAWPRWYAANRAVIGSNPHLLHPGQLLHAPPAPPAEEIP